MELLQRGVHVRHMAEGIAKAQEVGFAGGARQFLGAASAQLDAGQIHLRQHAGARVDANEAALLADQFASLARQETGADAHIDDLVA